MHLTNHAAGHSATYNSLRYSPPSVSGLSRNTSGTRGGDVVRLTGQDFGVYRPLVRFILPVPLRPTPARVLNWTQTSIFLITPAGASGGHEARVAIQVWSTTNSSGGLGQSVLLPGAFAYDAPTVDRIVVEAAEPGAGCSVHGCVLSISGENFGSWDLLAATAPAVSVNGGGSCVILTWTEVSITCTAPPGSGARTVVALTILNRTAVVNGSGFAYAGPAVAHVAPRVVDQRAVGVLFVLIGSNFASAGLQILVDGAPCTLVSLLNSSCVSCRLTRIPSIGVVTFTVIVNKQVSTTVDVSAVCASGYYGLAEDVNCQQCPPNALCDGHGSEPRADAGYWRLDRTTFDACIPPAACVQATSANASNCATGYTGGACRVCAPSFYRRNTECVPCPNDALFLIIIFIVLALLAGAAAAVMHRKKLNINGITIGVDMLQVRLR